MTYYNGYFDNPSPIDYSSYTNSQKREPDPQPICTAYIDTAEWKAAKKGIDVDCAINAGGQVFLAHKIKLKINSPYFEEILANSSPASNMGHHKIQCASIDPAILKILLKFIYIRAMSNRTQAEIRAGRLNLLEICKTAHLLGIKGISDWSSALLEAVIKKQKLTKGQFNEWLVLAWNTDSLPLFKVILRSNQLLNNAGYGLARLDDCLPLSINTASMNALVNKKNWSTFKKAASGLSDVLKTIDHCEKYNPIIHHAINS